MRDNLWHRSDIEDAYLAAIGRRALGDPDRERVFFSGSRFPPRAGRGRRARRAGDAAAAGRVEYRLLHYASRALYGALLDAGVEIQEYHKSFLHAKVAVIDGRWATVGSSNIDPFSLLLAREANVVVDDARFRGELRASLQRAIDAGARAGRAPRTGAGGRCRRASPTGRVTALRGC